MAPIKSTRNTISNNNQQQIPTSMRKSVTRRGNLAESILQHDQNMEITMMQTRGKRKAENSPVKNEKIKRSAFNNLTNNIKMPNNSSGDSDDVNSKKHNALKKKDINLQQIKNNSSKTNNNVTQVLQTRTQTQVLNVSNNNSSKIATNHGNLQRQAQNKIMTRAAAAARNAMITPLEDKNVPNIKISTNDANNVSILSTAPNNKIKKGEELPPPAAPLAHGAAVIKIPTKPARRISNEFNKTEDSLYMSALEDMSSLESSRLSGNFDDKKQRRSTLLTDKSKKTDIKATNDNKLDESIQKPPPGVEDFDRKNWNDPYQVSEYAMDIFSYLKTRESQFMIEDYMPRQVHISKWMRSLLVDWMVEVQETFELNHETLYLAVKIVDIYLTRVVILKDKLQLLGAAALFLSCKYDERIPPSVDDFLYICDGAYKHKELIHMEMTVFRTIDFDLGIPLSYRFLRRYARCGRVPVPTLTLARYILELSLMDYATISLSDSRVACAALFIALRMSGIEKPWNITFEYYSGFKLQDFAYIVPILNAALHRKPKNTIKTIFSKYSHKIFHGVANLTAKSNEELFQTYYTAKQMAELLAEHKSSPDSTTANA